MNTVFWYAYIILLSFESAIGCPVLGVGFTGSLASKRPKLGDHRYWLYDILRDLECSWLHIYNNTIDPLSG